MPLPVVIVGVFAYIGLSSLGLHLLDDNVPRSWRPATLSCFSLFFLAGWIWLIAGMMLGSARDGFLLLRWWMAFIGGALIAIGLFMVLPHPAVLLASSVLGVAFGSWVLTGKVRWIHRDL